MAKNMPQSRDQREVYYSEKLLGFQQHCDMPHCHNIEISTGWLCHRGTNDNDWFIGFECPVCGIGGSWSKDLQPLIDEVIQDAKRDRFDIDGAVRILREKHGKTYV